MVDESFDPVGLSYDGLLTVIHAAERELVALRARTSLEQGSWGRRRDMANLRLAAGLDEAKGDWAWQSAPSAVGPFPAWSRGRRAST